MKFRRAKGCEFMAFENKDGRGDCHVTEKRVKASGKQKGFNYKKRSCMSLWFGRK